MRRLANVVVPLGIVLLALAAASAGPLSADDRGSIVIVFKDGHRQAFALTELARIDFNNPVTAVFKDGHQEKLAATEIAHIEFESDGQNASMPSRSHFIGKWEVGDGGGKNFFITLKDDGDAEKSLGAAHGTWTLVDGEARVTWDDGWHDAIRKVGTKHEKFAYEPGKSFDDKPSNVTEARSTVVKPI
jgi:hypothetical protein